MSLWCLELSWYVSVGFTKDKINLNRKLVDFDELKEIVDLID